MIYDTPGSDTKDSKKHIKRKDEKEFKKEPQFATSQTMGTQD